MHTHPKLALGAGWRPELAWAIEQRTDLGFVELTLENLCPAQPIPEPVADLRTRGAQVVIHGVDLALAGADRPCAHRLAHLAQRAAETAAPLVSEHIAFVRAGGLHSGHLLPPPRTKAALEILVENVKLAQSELPVPLALENIAAQFHWPDDELSEMDFLLEVLERTDAPWLLDVSNLWASAVNHDLDLERFLRVMPLDRIAYVHVGGGAWRDGFYHDTHSDPVLGSILDLLAKLGHSTDLPGVMLEIDDRFPPNATWNAGLDDLATAAWPKVEEARL